MTIFGMITTATSSAYTRVALESFYYYTPLADTDRFLLIDNDNSAASLSIPPIKNLSIIKNPAPLGFAGNMNAILREGLATAADCVLLNNDLVFSPQWYAPLAIAGKEQVITAPLSNQQVCYASSVYVPSTQHLAKTFVLKNPMQLEDYIGSEGAFAAIVEAHRNTNGGSFEVLVAPFFCVRIPHAVLAAVGLFDEKFGRGGGEDYDYCLRAWLKGFRVENVLQSLLLHFGGKSSFDNEQEKQSYDAHQKHFVDYFNQKWGPSLTALFMSFRPDMDTILGEKKETFLEVSPHEKIRALLPAKVPSLEIF